MFVFSKKKFAFFRKSACFRKMLRNWKQLCFFKMFNHLKMIMFFNIVSKYKKVQDFQKKSGFLKNCWECFDSKFHNFSKMFRISKNVPIFQKWWQIFNISPLIFLQEFEKCSRIKNCSQFSKHAENVSVQNYHNISKMVPILKTCSEYFKKDHISIFQDFQIMFLFQKKFAD